MRIVLITQDEPFFLGRCLDHLLERLPPGAEVVGCVLLAPTPFGKRESMLDKLRRTYRVFGPEFLAHYLMKYATSRFDPRASVARVLSDHNVTILRLEEGINKPGSVERIKAFHPDLLISIAGNEIFKRPIIDLAPQGCLNLHSALLPRYRGLMPSFWVLKNREKETGVSVFFVDEGIDSGPILVQRRIEIGEMTQAELIEASKIVGMDAIIEAIAKIQKGDIATLPNDAATATYFKFPTRDDVTAFRAAGARFF